jgi:hypothetical protein
MATATETMLKAIAKIDAEAEKQSGTLAKQTAKYIIEELITDDATAAAIIASRATLEECVRDINNKARKRAVNNVAVVEDWEVFGWIREYYGIEADQTPQPAEDHALDFSLADML